MSPHKGSLIRTNEISGKGIIHLMVHPIVSECTFNEKESVL